jgi:hypothetical protein
MLDEKETENLLTTYHCDIDLAMKDEWLYFAELMENKTSVTLRDPESLYRDLNRNFLVEECSYLLSCGGCF